MSTNLGWQFYREYFRDLNAIGKDLAFDAEEINQLRQSSLLRRAKNLDVKRLKDLILPKEGTPSLRDLIEWIRIKNAILGKKIDASPEFKKELEKIEVEKKYYDLKRDQVLENTESGPVAITLGNAQFYAETTYPGLLIGTGYQHMTGGDAEFKIGFYFDYTSGQPLIPGSSVKGVLRSAFPYHHKYLGDNFRSTRLRYIRDLINQKAGIEVTDDQIHELEQEIFEGKDFSNNQEERLSLYQRDIFYDAVISEYTKDKLLATDYITPHNDPLKDPTPLMLLKVPPGAIFRFQFRLQNSVAIPEITASYKQDILKQIILDLGVGAKTNVGYGQLELVDVIAREKAKAEKAERDRETRENAQRIKAEKKIQEHKERVRTELIEKQSSKDKILEALKYKEGGEQTYDAEIMKENEAYFLFEVKGVSLVKSKQSVESKLVEQKAKRTKKGKNSEHEPILLGAKLKVTVKGTNDQGVDFTVTPRWKG